MLGISWNRVEITNTGSGSEVRSGPVRLCRIRTAKEGRKESGGSQPACSKGSDFSEGRAGLVGMCDCHASKSLQRAETRPVRMCGPDSKEDALMGKAVAHPEGGGAEGDAQRAPQSKASH